MYAIKYLKKQPYAVTKNAVELTKKLGKGGASGFVNAFLRKFIDYKFDYPKDLSEFLSVKYSYPEFAVKMLLSSFGEEETKNIISYENDFNTLCFYGIDGKDYLSNLGVNFDKTPFDNVFMVKNFVRNADYDKGVYTFQALGSVAICDVVDAGETLLDCCSAPGGKSIRLSTKFKDVYACDIHEHRVNLIEEYKKRMNVENVSTFTLDSKVFNPSWKDKFDAVLCDSPCSGLGVVNDNPDIKLNREENSVFELNKEQSLIVNNVSKYVKVNGFLYYSTCSVLNVENDLVIENFLKNNKDFVLEKISSPLNHKKTQFGLQFLPHISGGNGFYVSKLKRIK